MNLIYTVWLSACPTQNTRTHTHEKHNKHTEQRTLWKAHKVEQSLHEITNVRNGKTTARGSASVAKLQACHTEKLCSPLQVAML